MLRAAPLVAIATLLVNDHLLKAAWPSWWTGKLSDFAGLVFFPLLLQAVWEVACVGLWRSRRWRPDPRVLGVAIVLTAVVFTSIQTVTAAGEAYRAALGLLQAPFRGRFVPVAHTPDPTDLLALPALALAWFAGGSRR